MGGLENQHKAGEALGLTLAEFETLAHQRCPKVMDEKICFEKLKSAYNLTDNSDSFFIREMAVQLKTDWGFVLPTLLEQEIIKESPKATADAYIYQFRYQASYSHRQNWTAVEHTAEIAFVFGQAVTTHWSHDTTTATDDAVAENMMAMWSNFAKTGRPTSQGKKSPVYHLNKL